MSHTFMQLQTASERPKSLNAQINIFKSKWVGPQLIPTLDIALPNCLTEGKNQFYQDVLSGSHSCVSPTVLFQTDPSIGLRDVGLEVIKILKQGNKVVILDTNGKKKVRSSYSQLLKKKCGNVSISIVSILPKFGCQQLLWSREIHLAEESLLPKSERQPLAGEQNILQWFDKDTDEEIRYKHGIVDAISDDEVQGVVQKLVGLRVRTPYKFEVPGLLIQWEVLCTITRDGKLATSRLTKILQHWSSQNPCGRVIVVCDGSQIRTGEKSKSQQCIDVQNIVAQISAHFKDCPVYVLLVEDPQRCGGYGAPPRPGLLAYIQRRHNLDLHAKTALYMYETSNHMKMADEAGVRHIKASRLLEHPSLVVSSHVATTPPIPAMLRDVQFVQGDRVASQNAAIPLADQSSMFSDGKVHMKLDSGRSEFIFADNWDVVQRFQDLYSSMATRTGERGSNFVAQVSNTDDQETSQGDTSAIDQSKMEHLSRDLPKWMLPKDGSKSSKSSFSSSRSDSSSSIETRIRKMMYVMTEKELVESALDVLRQAGKAEVIARYEEKQKSNMSKEKSDRPKPRCPKEPTNFHPSTLADSTMCPKMEPMDVDMGSDMRCGNNNDANVKEKCREQKIDRVRSDANRVSRMREREEAVGDVLEDFLTATTTRRSSPRKRIRESSEHVDRGESHSRQNRFSSLLEEMFDTSKTDRNTSDVDEHLDCVKSVGAKGKHAIKDTVLDCYKSEYQAVNRRASPAKKKRTPDSSILDGII